MATRQLDTLKPDEEGVVAAVDAPRDLRHRLVEMGFVPGTTVAVAAVAPFGDPMEVALRGYRLAVRRSEAARVSLTSVGPVRVPEPVVPLRVERGGEGPGADGPRRPRRWFRMRTYGPGMRRLTRGHPSRIASDAVETSNAHQLMVPRCEEYAPIFSTKFAGTSPISRPR